MLRSRTLWRRIMEFAGFDWDRGNQKKCQKHGLSIAEIESVFDRRVVILPDKENPLGERRFRAIGTTAKGRNAFVGSARAVTAF